MVVVIYMKTVWLYLLIVSSLGCIRLRRCDRSTFKETRILSDGGQAKIYIVNSRGTAYIEKRFNHMRAFRVELEALSCIPRSSSIVKAICQDPDRRVIIMERIEGKKPRRLNFAQLKELVWTIEVIHRSGYVHGDVKPSNIIVRPNGRIVLIDFGLARKKGRLNGRFGTADYMAPEVSAGRPGHNVSLDWWSVGITAQRLLFSKSNLSRDLIGRMLERNPSRRLARCINLPNHPFFS